MLRGNYNGQAAGSGVNCAASMLQYAARARPREGDGTRLMAFNLMFVSGLVAPQSSLASCMIVGAWSRRTIKAVCTS